MTRNITAFYIERGENCQIIISQHTERVFKKDELKEYDVYMDTDEYIDWQFEQISQDAVGYCVTYGRKYDPFEKMILPFDDVTWYLLIISFLTGFATILILYRCPPTQQKFVFGTQISSPSLNLMQIFFGIALNRIPGRNFARFLLIIFTMFCLVIRTAYQGKMFEFITSDVRKPTANNIQEMFDMKFPIAKSETGKRRFFSFNRYPVLEE